MYVDPVICALGCIMFQKWLWGCEYFFINVLIYIYSLTNVYIYIYRMTTHIYTHMYNDYTHIQGL